MVRNLLLLTLITLLISCVDTATNGAHTTIKHYRIEVHFERGGVDTLDIYSEFKPSLSLFTEGVLVSGATVHANYVTHINFLNEVE